jgi:hypothetical protein
MADDGKTNQGNTQGQQGQGAPTPSPRGEGSPGEKGDKKGDASWLGRLVSFVTQPQVIGSTILAIAVIGVLVWLIFGVLGKRQVVPQLVEIAYARGLITYILAVGTIGIAILLTIGALVLQDAEKFNRGKEILTILVGVLGTIVGFYYGSETDARAGAGRLSISPPRLSNRAPLPGDSVEMTFVVRGGTPPYTYEVSFKDAPKNAAWERKVGHTDEMDWAAEKFDLKEAKAGSKLIYTIRAVDAAGAAQAYTSDDQCSINVTKKEDEKTPKKMEGT